VDVDGTEMKSAKVIDSPFYGGHGQSGEVPNFIHSQGVNVMITGGMGPKAIGFFNEFGIEVVTGASGRVRDALSSYLGGMLSGSESCRESERTPEKVESGDDKLSRLRKEAEFL
jgi:predicted Fe-Mo cluster-binding NifX family protein